MRRGQGQQNTAATSKGTKPPCALRGTTRIERADRRRGRAPRSVAPLSVGIRCAYAPGWGRRLAPASAAGSGVNFSGLARAGASSRRPRLPVRAPPPTLSVVAMLYLSLGVVRLARAALPRCLEYYHTRRDG